MEKYPFLTKITKSTKINSNFNLVQNNLKIDNLKILLNEQDLFLKHLRCFKIKRYIFYKREV